MGFSSCQNPTASRLYAVYDNFNCNSSVQPIEKVASMNKKHRQWSVLWFHLLLPYLLQTKFVGGEIFAFTECLFGRCIKVTRKWLNTYCMYMVLTLAKCVGLWSYKDMLIRIKTTPHREDTLVLIFSIELLLGWLAINCIYQDVYKLIEEIHLWLDVLKCIHKNLDMVYLSVIKSLHFLHFCTVVFSKWLWSHKTVIVLGQLANNLSRRTVSVKQYCFKSIL